MEQMKRLSIVWGILMVLIFGAFTTYGFIWKNKTKPYRELEEKLVRATEEYGEEAFELNEQLDGKKITYDTLVEKVYMTDELKVKDDLCDGYVKVAYRNGKISYKGYIKCSKYTTVNY